MNTLKSSRYVLPLGMALIAMPGLTATGCGSLDPASCDETIAARIEAFTVAVDALVKVSGELKASVGASCVAIAKDLGQANVPELGDPADPQFDQNLQAACTLANAGIDAEFKAGAKIAVEVIGGQCTIAADAQISCEASCTVTGQCDPGTLEVRCEPGELSGTCEAECKGECTVTTGGVECEGECSGACTGTCDGECAVKDSNGKCTGKCEGSCKGSCTGTCSVVPPSAKCSGSCKGGCSVEYKAPACEGKLEPPKCDLDADCQAGCNAQAQLQAECTPPEIKVTVDGGVSGKLGSTLETNLPALYTAAVDQGQKVIEAAVDVAERSGPAAAAVLDSVGCVAQFGANVAAQFEAAATASVSVSVSIEASASVSTKAGAN
ncbi:MAG: hypothetical protein FJ096_00110 [Deltaproteobacteria bacterium]|nr:hypothetical protein [Deltaproteobacteria bacterium]